MRETLKVAIFLHCESNKVETRKSTAETYQSLNKITHTRKYEKSEPRKSESEDLASCWRMFGLESRDDEPNHKKTCSAWQLTKLCGEMLIIFIKFEGIENIGAML